MASYPRSGGTAARTATTKATTTTAATPKSPFNHIESIAKGKKPNRVIRKLSRPLEKSSLDLDRTSAEQGLGVYLTNDSTTYELGSATRSLHDLTRSSNSTLGKKRNFHQRSTSGTSQFSSQTSGSYNRSGSFQHPFQQTPRPYTPPGGAAASFQGSLSSELNREKEPLVEEEMVNIRSASTISHHTVGTILPLLHEDSSDLPSKPTDQSPVVLSTSFSSNRYLNPSSSIFTSDTTTPSTNILLSSTDTTSPPSFRSSMDCNFRLRSRSDCGGADTRDYSHRGHVEMIREARRQFEDREREKEDRIEREQMRVIEKRKEKEARRAESKARKSSTSERSRERGRFGIYEKKRVVQIPKAYEPRRQTMEEIFARGYDAQPLQTPPATDPWFEEEPKKKRGAGKRTHSAWTAFMMWLRTRILRMSKKRDDYD